MLALALSFNVQCEGADLSGLRAEVEALRVANEVPSIAIAVAQHGQILWEQGFGWADRERAVAAGENTIYSVASVSKPITATGLMLLVQGGAIDLEKPVNEYLGAAALRSEVGDARGATLRRLANHTSGLPLHSEFYFAGQPYEVPSIEETIVRYGILTALPGERFQYSNLGFGILGHVIARVSGKSYPTFMRQHVFQPLGMYRSSVDLSPELAPYAAVPYDKTGARLSFLTDTPGASAVYASAHDLVRFAMFHLKDRISDQKQILSDKSIDEMHRVTAMESWRGYGIGWEVLDTKGGYHVLRHRGGMPGVAALLFLVPKEDFAVVVLSNGWGEHGLLGSPIWHLGDDIAHQFLPNWTALPESQEEPSQATLHSDQLRGAWAGTLHTYQRNLAISLEFLASGDVRVRLGDQLTTLLNEMSFRDGWLRGKFLGDVETDDADRHRGYYLDCLLKLRGDTLDGSITATTDESPGFELSQWVTLKKAKHQ